MTSVAPNLFIFDSGHKKLRGLFYETTMADKKDVVYTLKNRDHEVTVADAASGDKSRRVYPSLYRLYMETDDVTEYTFATRYLDGWDHWLQLCDCNWFKPYVAAWRKELEIKTKAAALKAIRDLAKDPDSKEHYQASKFLVTNGWVDKSSGRKGAGRPSKDEVKKAANQLAQEQKELNDEFARVTGAVN